MPFSRVAYDHLGKGYLFITVLRDPVERFISEYFYNMNRNHQGRIETNLEEYVESPLGRRNALKFCEYFSGGPEFGIEDPENLKSAAKTNLREFDAIGFTDTLDKFESQVRNMLGIRFSFGRENQGDRSTTEIQRHVSPILRKRIESLCAHDQEVYDFARKFALPSERNS